MTERLQTNFNISPYFDDYDPNKKYYRILFRPATAVQARELTQLQTVLQEQISRFADFNFKNGAVVSACNITYLPRLDYVHLEDTFTSNTSLTTADIPNTYLVTNTQDSNNAVRAVVIASDQGYEDNYPETNKFYLKYITSGKTSTGAQQDTFLSGETLYIYNENQDKFGTLDANNIVDTINVMTANSTVTPIGQGYGVTVGDGIVYQKGFFINVDEHTVVVNSANTDPSGYVVGFSTSEEIVWPENDASLYDNANGSSNYKAPGAHRLKLSATLIAKRKEDIGSDDNFFSIVEFDNNMPNEKRVGEEGLRIIRDIIAKRTKEESGNYVVKPFTVETVPHTSNSDMFTYEISSGIAYVNGYRVEKLNTFRIDTERATTTDEAQAQIISANYGSYIKVNEILGVFDFKSLEKIYLYDSAQTAVTQYEGTGSTLVGNIIGEANVRMMKYDTGKKGTSSAIYRMYITNIQMYSGHAFSEIKSVATLGAGAVADVVLENNIAKIYDAENNLLVWDFGVDAIKRLRDKNGVNDTQYVVRDITSATLGVDGTVTFTTNTPPNGGAERINAGIGIISDTKELNFDIVLSSPAYSANLAGTVDLTNANGTIITGLGTAFTSVFESGDYIYITSGTNKYVRRIVDVTNDTTIVVDSDIVDTNTAATYQKYYPAGHVIDLSGSAGTIEVLSNTQFKVTTDLPAGTGTLDSGTQIVYAEFPILRTQATEKKKIINKDVYVKIDCSTHTNGSTGPWSLGFVDIHKVKGIYVGTTYDENNPERSEWFHIDDGQRDDIYDVGRLVLNPKYKNFINSSTKILVKLDVFTEDTTTGIGFFSVDSYPIDDVNIANTAAITTAEIPKYYSSTKNRYINLRNAVDFRPRRFNTAIFATTIASASENPAEANTSIDITSPSMHLADVDKTFQADLEYYLPRIDLVIMDNNGNVTIRRGEPNTVPVEPKNEHNNLVLAKSYVAPYPSLTTREAENYNRHDITIKTNIVSVKGYTMKDIDALEKRISRMEYYTTLNLLEQQAKDLIIPDENGLDRFKNGIFADNFNSHLGGKVQDIEYSIAIDKDLGIARPIFETKPIDFKYDSTSSTNITKIGHYLLLPFNSEKFIEQKHATKFRNVTANMWHWNGNIKIYPSYDHFRDEKYTPAINVNLDLSKPWEDFANSPFGTHYGEWRVISQTDSDPFPSNSLGENYLTIETTTISEAVVSKLNVNTFSETFNMGTYVNDVSISPYMRSKLIAIIVTGLKPNTQMHVFFDGINVDEYCAPAQLSGMTEVEAGKESDILSRNGNFGDVIYTDNFGNFYALFRIPENTFRIGERTLVVSNVDNLETGTDAQISMASTIYTSLPISVSKNNLTLTTNNPEIKSFSSLEQKTEITTSTIYVPPQKTSGSEIWGGDGNMGNPGVGGTTFGGCGCEPIAQTFLVQTPNANIPGIFLEKIGVYFKSKDNNLGCLLYVTETDNGYPNGKRIIGKGYLSSNEINVSSDASVETIFTLDNPIFLENGKEYSFVVYPDGNSPEYEIWTAELGNFDILTNEQVFQNPNIGIMFVSANMFGWTAVQTEDLKFNLYRCKFTTDKGTASFQNEDDDYFVVDGFTKNGDVRIEVGDFVYHRDPSTNTIITSSTANNYAFGIVQDIDEGINEITLDSSNGGFAVNDIIEIHRPIDGQTVSGNTLIATATIQEIVNPEYHVVVPRFADMQPSLTNIAYKFKGSDINGILDINWRVVKNDMDTELLDKPLYVISKSNQTGTEKSAFFECDFKSYNTYLSPVIDLRRKASLFIKNIINNDSTDEHLRTGNAKTKYVSINTTLDSRLGDAEDMKVFVGAYRPIGTDIEVYVKLLGSDDGDPFDEKLWTKMEMTSGSSVLYSKPFDTSDYREFEFDMPTEIQHTVGNQTTAWLNNGVVTYKRKDGSDVNRFKTYCFKVVLKAESGHKVPRLADFRAIALQK